MIPVVRDRQARFVRSESSNNRLPLRQERTCRPHTRRDRSDNRHKATSLFSHRRAQGRTVTLWLRAPVDLTMTLGVFVEVAAPGYLLLVGADER